MNLEHLAVMKCQEVLRKQENRNVSRGTGANPIEFPWPSLEQLEEKPNKQTKKQIIGFNLRYIMSYIDTNE